MAGVGRAGRGRRYPLTDATRVADVAAIRSRFAERATALIETTLLRRKAAVKLAGLADVSGWLFTDEALQQATAAAVAAHRAARLAGAVVHDATCSIGTELAALRLTAAVVLGSDLDEVRLAMARHNLPDVALCRADALRPVSRDAVVLLDPARRSGGRRRFDPSAYTPPLDAADGDLPRARDGGQVRAGHRLRRGAQARFRRRDRGDVGRRVGAGGLPVVGAAGAARVCAGAPACSTAARW